MWTQEISLMNLVSPTSLYHVSHWDLCRATVGLSLAYFVVWKACVGWLLTSLPLFLFVLDSTYLSALNINMDVFSTRLDAFHPLVARLGILAYFVLCLWACDLALTVLAQMSSTAYAKIFEAPELFRRDLQATFPHSPLSFPLPPSLHHDHHQPARSDGDGRRQLLHRPLTTYSRVSSGRTCMADTLSPVAMVDVTSKATGTSTGYVAKKPSPNAPLALSLHESEQVQDRTLLCVPEKVRLPQLRVATAAPAYDCLSPTQPPSSYETMSPASSPAVLDPMARPLVSRALPHPPHPSNPSSNVEDAHFAMYGPRTIRPSRPFSLHVWVFADTQRADMHELAVDTMGHRSLSRETLLQNVSHGTLIQATLDVPRGFNLLHPLSASQSMVWTGDLHRLAFRLQSQGHRQSDAGHVLFKVTLVVGSVVCSLRSYVLVHTTDDSSDRRRPVSTNQTDDDDDADDDMVQCLESVLEVLDDTYEEIPYCDLDMHEWIGSGAGGDAYRARFRGQEVVVKTIRASEYGSSGDAIQAAFQHEAAILNRFGHHPHMVPFVGACSDLSTPLSVVTSFMPLGSLESQFSSSTLDKDLLLADVAAATCRNVLVDDNGRGILSDFGMCRRVGHAGGAFVQHGSGPLKYMAPETLQPPYGFTAKADVYAFGVLAWETLFESKPFANLTPLQAAVRVLEGQRLPMGEELSDTHRELLTACFQDNPTDRPTMQWIYGTLRKAQQSTWLHNDGDDDSGNKRPPSAITRRPKREVSS
ncbi:hypothetical protein DYB35_003853 [Aphanomyces astaci]|uniref:Protein kinase domain-containing protein n=1 Tax=Aphanomyces astaci TaxID=112090 RepID=A0A418D7T0_APHAT|nr:hypothetical protein DYB35_003853 [Aphanomyces astaci]